MLSVQEYCMIFLTASLITNLLLLVLFYIIDNSFDNCAVKVDEFHVFNLFYVL